MVLFAVIVGMLWVVGLPGRPMAAVVAAVGVVCVFFVAIEQERVTRMLSFLNPMADPDRAGYQSIHSMIAALCRLRRSSLLAANALVKLIAGPANAPAALRCLMK